MPRSATRRARLVRWGLIGVAVILLAWCAAGAVMLLRARSAANDAINELEHVRDTLEPRDVLEGADTSGLHRAKDNFEDAHAAVTSPLVAPLRFIPIVGRQVRAVDQMVDAAATVTDVGIQALDAAGTELAVTPASGAERSAVAKKVGQIAADADARLKTVDIGSDSALIGPVADAHRRLSEELDELRETTAKAAIAAVGITQFLDGPTKYLVLAANAGEMRAGSGMFLQAGVLSVNAGEFDLSPMRSTTELRLQPGAVPLTGDLADRWGFVGPNQEWRNLGMSPRFDANAELASKMWTAATGETVDGVMALDAIAMQAVLAATGPVEVEGEQISADNVVFELLVGQYEGVTDYLEHDLRRERLSEIAGAAVDALDNGGWDVSVLVDELRGAADGRHVLAWSSKPAQEAAWQAAGITGELPADAVLLSVINQGGTKLDPFLAVSAELSSARDSDQRQVTVRIDIKNEAPDDLPPYVEGPTTVEQEGISRGVAEGIYAGIVTLNVPGVARDIHLGTGQLLVAGADGNTRVVGTRIQLGRGESVQLIATFDLPADLRSVRVEPSGRVPASKWSAYGESWEDSRVHRVKLEN